MYFGKNIKKIRSIKKLSQLAFAELFGIKRSSIGSYEEERAEPKLEIIIKIAKHFNISVDSLVNKEITVNELYNFHLPNEYIGDCKSVKHGLDKKQKINTIPLVLLTNLLLKSLEQARSESENIISLPRLTDSYIAIEIDKDTLAQMPKQLTVSDIIIVDSKFEFNDESSFTKQLFLLKHENKLSIAEIQKINKNEFLLVSTNNTPVAIHKSKIDFLLPVVKHIVNNTEADYSASDRINKLELLINDLYNRV